MDNKIYNPIIRRWKRPYGYKQILLVAFPLILSTGSWSIQQFVDRMFLSWYSTDALAAALPAGILSFTLISIFLGTAGYVNTFVAQYQGANREDRIGSVMWQGLYVSLIGGFVVFLTFFARQNIFDIIGHEAAVREFEIEYWKYLSVGGFFPIGIAAVSSFFSGRGKTYPLMWISFAATLVNIVLNYLLIFGKFGFPEMGIAGAGLSTIVSQGFNFLILLSMAFDSNNNSRFGTVSGWRFDLLLFKRLIKFGLPNGIQIFLDVAAFSIFLLIIGRLGPTELAASNIAINISLLAFMPMTGIGIAISMLVGRALGSNKPDLADRATISTLQIAFVYMGSFSMLYLIFPDMFIYPFAANSEASRFEEIRVLAVMTMKFVAAWALLDCLGITISSALKGAGDTFFIMVSNTVISFIVLIVPTYLALEIFGLGLAAAWSASVTYVIILTITFVLRYKTGKWRSMRVIEETSNFSTV